MSTLTTKTIKPCCAWFTVNRLCDLQCKWCYGQGESLGPDSNMTIQMAKDLLVLVQSIGIKHITLIGGEPTLWQPLIEFNQMCSDSGVSTAIVTNAIRFGDDEFWDQYIAHRNQTVSVSIKAHDAQLLKDATASLQFTQMQKGLCRAFAQFKIGASTVYNNICASHILDIARFAMDCGASRLNISPCTPAFYNGEFRADYIVEPAAMVKHLVEVYPKLDEITGGRISIAMKLPFCFWPRDFIDMLLNKGQITSSCQLRQHAGIIFDSNGNVSVCNSLSSFPVGKYGSDFTSGASLLTHMNSSTVTRIYEKITSYPSTKCIDCEKYDTCGGGCAMFWTFFNPQACIPGWK